MGVPLAGPSRIGSLLFTFLLGAYLLWVTTPFKLGTFDHDLHAIASERLRHTSTWARDPYAQPGYLNVSLDDPLQTAWVTTGDSRLVTPDWLNTLRIADNSPLIPVPEWNGAAPGFRREPSARTQLEDLDEETRTRMRKQALQKISHLHNSTILLIGDSVDRNFLDQFAWITQAEHGQESFDGKPFNASEIKCWGYPHTVTIRSDINLKLANMFFYGSMDETDDFAVAPDWLPPGKAEDRVETLFKPFTDRLEHPISLIQFHAGLWDLAYFGREDKRMKMNTSSPLSEERLEQWRVRTTSVIRKMQRTWPGVPIVFRMVHRVGDNQSASIDYGGSTNFFTNLRIHQLRHAQRAVARDLGIALWDFGEAFEGYQSFQDKVHPYLWPAGILMSQALLHQAYLAKTFGV